jgi:Tfp pilus assembly protein PilF
MTAGVMPTLATLARDGRSGVLTTIHPPLSPLVWTTMMTGADPLEHGILDFTRLNPRSGAREPITSAERRVPAIWNMASGAGRSVAVFGLWATWPAEPVRGVLVSDRLFSFQHAEASPPPGIVQPADREAWARATLSRVESGVDRAALQVYLPWLQESEYRLAVARPDPYAQPVSALRRILIETRVYHALATETIARERPDLALVYIQGTDTIGHVFAPYAPPRQAAITPTQFERYSRVPETYFREIDRLLADYRDLARATGAILLIASDHGFLWGDGRPAGSGSLAAATAAKWHRDEGIYLLWNPADAAAPAAGAAHGSAMPPRASPGSVQQICPTLLALLGLPADGRDSLPPLPGVTATPGPPADYRAQFRQAAAADPEPAAAPAVAAADDAAAAAANAEALAKLQSLGYIGSGEAMAAPRGGDGSTRTAGSYNTEGLILRERGRTSEAIAAFEQALRLDPGHAASLWNLSDLLYAERRDLDRSDDFLRRAVAAGQPDGAAQVAGRVTAYRRAAQAERGVRLLDGALRARPDEADLRLLRGRLRIDGGDCAGALADFEAAARHAPDNALAFASSGLARLCLDDRRAALADFRRSLAIDPDQPELQKYVDPRPGDPR